MPYQIIVETINQILHERGDPVPELTPATPIMNTGLDSLDIASLVVRLEDRLGFDPFVEMPAEEYPQTLEALAAVYAQAVHA